MNILSVGDLLLDVVVRYDPQSGEVDTGGEVAQLWPGGSAANFAVQAARLGAGVRFISRVGPDWEGEMLTRSMTGEGVITSLRTAGVPTGRVLVMVDPEGHRRMWSYPGASRTIAVEDLNPAWFEGLDAFHLTGYSLLRDEPRAAAIEALRLARAGGSPLCTLDPNPPHLIEDFGPARFRELIAGLHFDAIFPNQDEGMLLSGKGAPGEIATSLLDVAPLVVLKLGAQGCLVATREGRLPVEAIPPHEVVDVTGAGDAFAAAFVVEYLRGRDLRAAAVAANRLASQVVARAGGR